MHYYTTLLLNLSYIKSSVIAKYKHSATYPSLVRNNANVSWRRLPQIETPMNRSGYRNEKIGHRGDD